MTSINRLVAAATGLLLTPVLAFADCPLPTAPIGDIAGPGPALAAGEPVTAHGIVTGDFRGEERLRGFFLQSTEAVAEGFPQAVFVFTPDLAPDAGDFGPGSEVVVVGEAAEHRGRPQIGWVDSVVVCGEPGLPEPVPLPFPEAERAAWEALEGVLVEIEEPLTVTSNFHLARHGTLELAAGGRLFRPTQFVDVPPPAGRGARRIWLDDANYRHGPQPVPYLDEHGTRRVGSVVPELTGILTHAFGDWRIHPLDPAALVFEEANPRPVPPGRPHGARRVVGFNVENYFLTLGARGADTRAELQRQRHQLEAVVEGLQPDILGIVEVENRPAAVADLVQRLGEATGVESGYEHFAIEEPVGTDAIRVALAWDPGRVELIDGPLVDDDPVHHRPPVAGHFLFTDEGPGKIVAVIHHKSKRGCPDEGDIDRGQGCWNERRTQQSAALARFLGRKRSQTGADRILIVGDINSYGGEDPVAELRTAGYDDLLRRLPREERYTYVFRGESGNLDVALASSGLASDIAGVKLWHINADEPAALHDFTSVDGPWRSSDHDPVIVDVPIDE